jgi:hypothetical protein
MRAVEAVDLYCFRSYVSCSILAILPVNTMQRLVSSSDFDANECGFGGVDGKLAMDGHRRRYWGYDGPYNTTVSPLVTRKKNDNGGATALHTSLVWDKCVHV